MNGSNDDTPRLEHYDNGSWWGNPHAGPSGSKVVQHGERTGVESSRDHPKEEAREPRKTSPRKLKPPGFYLKELSASSPSNHEHVKRIHRRIEVLRQQGLNVKEHLRQMDAILYGTTEDKESVARSYHHYLEAEGCFDEEPIFVTRSGSSCIEGCIGGNAYGTVFIHRADKLSSCCVEALKNMRSKGLVLIFGLKRKSVRKTVPDTLTRCSLELEVGDELNFDRLEYAHASFMSSLDKLYGGCMELEGGRDGPHIRLCLRRLLKTMKGDSTRAEVNDAVYSSQEQILDRQLRRLGNADYSAESSDALSLTAEDILGPNPGSSKLHETEEWNDLQQLIGLETVKASVESHMRGLVVNHYRALNERPPLEICLSRLCVGGPGTGKSTVATLYGRMLAKMGILSKGCLVVKKGIDFVGAHIGESGERTTRILKKAKGHVLLVDEAYVLNPKRKDRSPCQFRQEAIDTLIGEITNEPGEDICVLLCGYKQEMEELLQDANPGLRRRFPIENALVFEDYSDTQLGQILDLKARNQQILISPEGREVAMKVIGLAKQRPHFGNAGEVVNTLSRAIEHLRSRIGPELQALPETARITRIRTIQIEPRDFDPDYLRIKTAEDKVHREFISFVGLDEQIDKMRAMARRVENMTRNSLDPKPFVDFAFVFNGPPGSGKTTFARCLGALYYQMGILATKEVVEVSTSDLVAGYIGQTALKTRDVLEKALGKVLFIDEAYRLQGRDKHDRSGGSCFAAEARDEIVDAMTKPAFMHRIVIVLSGYENLMNDMLCSNPGLASRFHTRLTFPSLSAPSCVALLKREMIQCQISVNLGAHESLIEHVFEQFRQSNGWGNGRDVQDIAKEVVGNVFEIGKPQQGWYANIRIVLSTMQRWYKGSQPIKWPRLDFIEITNPSAPSCASLRNSHIPPGMLNLTK
jgi:AAA+ superfamily predicted ATPase